MAMYLLPGIGGQVADTGKNTPIQMSPILHSYSPRLFGAPPQLTHLNDMRLLSADGDNLGAVGDFYLTKVLQDAQVANFVVGHAIFTGGMNSLANIIRICGQYARALSKYDVLGNDGTTVRGTAYQSVMDQTSLDTYKAALESDDNDQVYTKKTDSSMMDLDEDNTVTDISSLGNAEELINLLADTLGAGSDSSNEEVGGNNGDGEQSKTASLAAMLLTSLAVQQPYYTFESDWFSYINNVKMMINTAVIMLGLQEACVREGDTYYPIGMDVNVTADTDVWSNYRFITPTEGTGDVTAIDTQVGDTTQYVSFMIDPSGITESFTNNVGDSQIYSSVLNMGASYGNEIAFITNSSTTSIDDAVVNIAGDVIGVAEKVMTSLTGGVGRFTAAIAGSMAKSFIGDHTIYPQIFQSHTSTSSMSITIHLTASSGDPYAYLTDILVPYFFILGMALPQLSRHNASSYSYPPLVQCNIPGMWGTRLGMVTGVEARKNPNGKDVSIHGWPTALDVTMTITDLQHTLVTSPMNKISTFLNNHTMFDYIAQMSGVDKYRVNGSMRLVARLALANSACNNFFNNLGHAFLTDATQLANRITGTYRL